MNAKRKRKLPDRETRLPEFRQPSQSAQWLSGSEISFRREVDYIVGRAVEHDSRCVSLGVLIFFSTQSGDAWMLDTEDGLALWLARDGVRQPVRIVETDSTSAVEWDRTFSIAGDCFTTVEKKTGRTTTVLGYPTQAILAAIRNAKEAQA